MVRRHNLHRVDICTPQQLAEVPIRRTTLVRRVPASLAIPPLDESLGILHAMGVHVTNRHHLHLTNPHCLRQIAHPHATDADATDRDPLARS